MGALFGIVGSLVTAAAHHGIERAFHPEAHAETKVPAHGASHETSAAKTEHGASRSKETEEAASSHEARPGILEETVKEVGGKLVDKGADATKEGIGIKKLAKAAEPTIPSDRDEFLQTMKNAPDAWKRSITANIDQLFDVDLAALVGGLPKEEEVSVGKFEAKIGATLQRFDDQVLAIKELSGTHPIVVVPRQGPVRRALVTKEMRRNPNLHGEWKNADVWTGKWSFVRWIDADMVELAVARSQQIDGNAANTTYRTASDGAFWDEASRNRIAAELGEA
jgi:hypothetical protein